MSEAQDLHAQLAQRLFGWRWEDAAQLWRDPDGMYRDAATFRRRMPAYTTDPAATALVWQWLEEQHDADALEITFDYHRLTVGCGVTRWAMQTPMVLSAMGATWQEALCRAALALALALEKGEG